MKCLLSIVLLLSTNLLFSQDDWLIYKVVDSKSLLPLSFATVAINYPSDTYTITDIDGYFKVDKLLHIQNFKFSFIGYESKTVVGPFTENQIFKLNRSITSIDEVLVTPDYKVHYASA